MAEKEGMLQRGLGLLHVLGDHPEGVGLTEISREAALPLSTVHRLLAVMIPEGFVKLDEETRRYFLGLAVFELAQRVATARSLSEVALPVMRKLSATTQETTFLSVLEDTDIVYLERVDGPRRVSIAGAVGRRGPAYSTSMGKALLAFQPEDTRGELVRRLSLERFTPKTITDPDALEAELERVRKSGFAVVDEEYEEGIRALAAPVLDARGVAVAAICVAAPVFRVPLRTLRGFGAPVREAAHQLSLQLPSPAGGGRNDRPGAVGTGS